MEDESRSNEGFPVVSIKHLTEKYLNGDISVERLHDDPDVKSILSMLSDAFTEWGFVYLTDHGIIPDSAFKTSRIFFEKDRSFKSQFPRLGDDNNWGYVPFKMETFEKQRPFDLKECFNFTIPCHHPDEKLNQISQLVEVALKFSNDCQRLAKLLLRVLSAAIPTDTKDFFSSKHQHIGDNSRNPTTFRSLYYPAVDEGDVLEKQLRCGEHSDYGTLTLLFQDEAGGLQVVSPNGEYVDAVPIPGSIVVNVGDMMEIWTSGRFKSTRHRVLIQNKHKKPRQSLAYFVHPDNVVDVSCLDGSDKYKTVNAFKYLMNKFGEQY